MVKLVPAADTYVPPQLQRAAAGLPTWIPDLNRKGANALSAATDIEQPQHATTRPIPPPAPKVQSAAPDLITNLKRLTGLRASGTLSDAESEALKAQILAQASRA